MDLPIPVSPSQDVDDTLYLGNLGETIHNAYRHYEQLPGENFRGCVRNLRVNGKPYPLTQDAGWQGGSNTDTGGATGAPLRYASQVV